MMAENNLVYDPFMTVLDDALYEFARRRYDENNYTNNDTALWVKAFANTSTVQRYFLDGITRNCTNPCCGKCSKWR